MTGDQDGATAAPGASSPESRPGEQPPKVFISSVMDDELEGARTETVNALDLMPGVSVWAFEFTPASSEQVDSGYLRHVREADAVIWLVGSTTTAPVCSEIREALAARRRILAFKLSAERRDQATESLLAEVGRRAKWRSVASLAELGQDVAHAMWDELVRAYRGMPGMGRRERLDELWRTARARMIDRWLAVGLNPEEAESFADDPRVGAPASDLRPSARDPVVVLRAELGAGKSLAAERLIQEAVISALRDASSPVPVYLPGQRAAGPLQEAVEAASSHLGDPHRQGAFVTVDGGDEAGAELALRLVSEARILARTWPSTSVVITTRPVPALGEVHEVRDLVPLEREDALALVSLVAGHQVSDWHWPDALRDATRRPLFALLLGIHLRQSDGHTPRSLAELISGLVQRALTGTPLVAAEALLERLARLQTERGGSFVPLGDVGSPGELAPLLESRLVVQRDSAVGFPLPVLTQWFAARLLAAGKPDPSALADQPEQRELWRYPMVMATATLGHDQVSAFLGPVAERDPALAAEIIEESLAQWGLSEEVSPPPTLECARRVRGAAQALVTGIGRLAEVMHPCRSDGSLRTLGARVHGASLVTGWCSRDEVEKDIAELPAHLDPLSGARAPWIGLRIARPGHQPAWAWRWALEELRRSLEHQLKRRALVPPGPLQREAAWATALAALDRGPLDPGPLPLDPLIKFMERPDTREAHGLAHRGKEYPLEPLRAEVAEAHRRGRDLISPYPGPDRVMHGSWVWDMYSDERLLARAEAVFAAALHGYTSLVDHWFLTLAPRLRTAATLPARLVGALKPASTTDSMVGPAIWWILDPVPGGELTSVDLRLGDERPGEDRLDLVDARLGALRSGAANQIHATLHHEVLDVFSSCPATELAYSWLWTEGLLHV